LHVFNTSVGPLHFFINFLFMPFACFSRIFSFFCWLVRSLYILMALTLCHPLYIFFQFDIWLLVLCMYYFVVLLYVLLKLYPIMSTCFVSNTAFLLKRSTASPRVCCFIAGDGVQGLAHAEQASTPPQSQSPALKPTFPWFCTYMSFKSFLL
jgi:hypothetical protein